ncbi:hypothetical protein H4R33_002483 [Dimargaris cristalligena]|uniref:Putative polysaccharide biosynthesis protein n=1 Tax=Dimargaris cristalligena TaxID=215637 RepID=A0A4P9ZLB8_9FUNG|nr:hypothetical protein H4R33_002483 [Dimargaris cristalligena]RKP34067.1 putative polysaccharide biosynthesis protein [Dimargaris cristalligena]|eukprot:RKP34067.1 putative polysaccharide biosynthesis protein [Dimargaris cristalligena]
MVLPKAEDLEQLEEIEKQWAVKAMYHAETYYGLLEKVDCTKLRLTPIDNELYSDFRTTFPHINVEALDENDFKSPAAKITWRGFIEKYENRVKDYNFGCLLRKHYDQGYTEANTMFVVRTQFYCVEIARNQLGLNKVIYEKAH